MNFTCPKCGGHYFGRDTAKLSDGTVGVLATVRCHADGCGWHGEWIEERAMNANELHDAIMNLPCNESTTVPPLRATYARGHRDARHAAAELVLALHADDGEPVTEEWLTSILPFVGGVWTNGFKYIEHGTGSKTIVVSLPVDGQEEWSVGGERVPHELMPSTRGDVLRLLSALGVEVQR